MNKIFFWGLSVFKSIRKTGLKITGKKEEDIIDQRVVSGKSWDEFCDNLKVAGAALLYPGAPRDPFQQAEGLRYLSRLTRAGLEAFVEFNDPEFPIFRRMVHETVKMGADNPDNYYLNAQIDGKNEYIIRGKRNTIDYFGVFTQNGNYGTTGGLSPCGVIEDGELVLEKDGSFEIILSKKRRGKNWLRIEDETGMVMVRETFLRRDKEIPVEIEIEMINVPDSPKPITPENIDSGLKTAGLFVAGAPMLFAKWAKGFKKHANQLPLFDPKISNAAGGDARITYYHSYWNLEEDEALVIEVQPPECETWNFQLNNYWMESLDYRYFTICISKGNAVFESDGSIWVVVAHQNPGLPNWIETSGHTEGTMCWRWYRAESENLPQPKTKVIKFNQLKKYGQG